MITKLETILGSLLTKIRGWFSDYAVRDNRQTKTDAFESIVNEKSVSELPDNKPSPRKSIAPLRNKVECEILHILDLFENVKIDMPHGSKNTRHNAHNNLIGCDYHYVSQLAEDTSGEEKLYYEPGESDIVTAMWPIDVAIIIKPANSVNFATSRVSTAAPSAVRGIVKLVPERIITLCYGEIDPGAVWWAENNILGCINGRWQLIETPVISSKTTATGTVQTMRSAPDASRLDEVANMCASIALTERYSWHVALGYGGNGPRLLLPTNPDGCLKLFSDRDKPPEGRRDALKHWVQNHYRQVEKSQMGVAYVCDHLRGATNFTWRGMECEILVSAFDLEKNQMFRDQAAQWRSQRSHNKPSFKRNRRRR